MGGSDSDLLSQIRDQFRDLPERLAIALSRYGALAGAGVTGDGGPGTAGGPPGFRDRWGATQGLFGALGSFGIPGLSQLAGLMGNLARLADASQRFGAAFGVGTPTLVSGDRVSPFTTPSGGLPAGVPPPATPAGLAPPVNAAASTAPGLPPAVTPPTVPPLPSGTAPAPPQVLTDAERAQLQKQWGVAGAALIEKGMAEQAAAPAAVPPPPLPIPPPPPVPPAVVSAPPVVLPPPPAGVSAPPAAPAVPQATPAPAAPPVSPALAPPPVSPPGPVPATTTGPLPAPSAPVPAAPVVAPVTPPPPPPLPPPHPDVPAVGEAERREFTAGWDAGLAGLLPPGGPPEVGGGLWPAAGEEAAVPGAKGTRQDESFDELKEAVRELTKAVKESKVAGAESPAAADAATGGEGHPLYPREQPPSLRPSPPPDPTRDLDAMARKLGNVLKVAEVLV